MQQGTTDGYKQITLHKEVMRQSGATMLKIFSLKFSADTDFCRSLLGKSLQREVYHKTTAWESLGWGKYMYFSPYVLGNSRALHPTQHTFSALLRCFSTHPLQFSLQLHYWKCKLEVTLDGIVGMVGIVWWLEWVILDLNDYVAV